MEISTITKGVPIAKLELRHQRLPFTRTNVQVKYMYSLVPVKTNPLSTQEARVIVNGALEKLLREDAAPAQLQVWGQT